MSASAIKIESLDKSFRGEEVLYDIAFEVEKGEFCVIIGPSGCGKSTLLKCTAGLFDYDGDVYLDGENANEVPVAQRNLGFVFQEFEETLFPHMTVGENAAFGLQQQDVPATKIEERVAEILELLAISETKDDYPDQLSGGQQQRVELARQLVRQCDILLLDDPLADLDYKLQKKMELEMRRIHDDLGSTFMYVTHNQDQALKLADKVVVMNHGQIEQIGTPETVYYEPINAFVGRFLGDSNLLITEGVTETDGVVTAETVIGTVTATNTGETNEGTEKGIVLLRPELVAIGTDAESTENRITGTLIGRNYTGEFTEFDVSIDGLQNEFQVVVPGNERVGTIGDEIQIGWDAKDARYLETISVTDRTTIADLEEL